MEVYNYKTKGVCSTNIELKIEGEKLVDINVTGGCNGNLKAISKLVNGKQASEISTILAGNTCGPRPTSCADQLSIALQKAISNEQ